MTIEFESQGLVYYFSDRAHSSAGNAKANLCYLLAENPGALPLRCSWSVAVDGP